MDKNNIEKKINLKEIKNKILIGLDIGGSLSKLCILSDKNEKDINDFLSKKNFEKFDLNKYNLFLTSFQTFNFEKDVIEIIKDLNNKVKINEINLTGGGAYKFNDILKKNFEMELIKHEELQSLINGYQFVTILIHFLK